MVRITELISDYKEDLAKDIARGRNLEPYYDSDSDYDLGKDQGSPA